jgi:hypothetical protein
MRVLAACPETGFALPRDVMAASGLGMDAFYAAIRHLKAACFLCTHWTSNCSFWVHGRPTAAILELSGHDA